VQTAGMLALTAGLLAYVVGRQQVDAVEKQNHWLRRSERRRMARDGIIATRLIDAMLIRMRDDIAKMRKVLEQDQYRKVNATVPSDFSRLIHKPDISVVWDQLGRCDPDTIRSYMDLDAEIGQYWDRPIHGRQYHQDKLNTFGSIVNLLRDSLEGQARQCMNILLETERE
jgi:hypothetical protein